MAIYLDGRKTQDISDDDVWAHVFDQIPGAPAYTDVQRQLARQILMREWKRSGMENAPAKTETEDDLDRDINRMIEDPVATANHSQWRKGGNR